MNPNRMCFEGNRSLVFLLAFLRHFNLFFEDRSSIGVDPRSEIRARERTCVLVAYLRA